MDFFMEQLVNGLRLGSIYALIAIGYSIVYGILRLINFAHGDLLMVATYAAWCVVSLALPWPVAIAGAVVITVLFAVVIEVVAYRPLRKAGEETTMMTSLAVSLFLENLATLIFSAQAKAFTLPAFFSRSFQIGGVYITSLNVLTLSVTIVCVLAVTLLVGRTRIGMAMRACSDNMDASELMGININTIVTFAFVVGAVLASVAGILYSGEYTSFSPDMGFMIGIKAFIAAVIGGIGSLSGATVGGFLLGILEMMFAGYLPSGVTEYRTAFVFLILIVVLVVRPNGLLGRTDEKRS
jgi:branched-chain amino acid transport system permease protein